MFREPRENAELSSNERHLPSTGRPPTPPQSNNSAKKHSLIRSQISTPTPKMTMQNPVVGRQPTLRSSNVRNNTPKQTQSILNFFGKTEKPANDARGETRLFFEDAGKHRLRGLSPDEALLSSEQAILDNGSRTESPGERFNEDNSSVKRRRTDDGNEGYLLVRTPSPEIRSSPSVDRNHEPATQAFERPQHPFKSPKRRGGFDDESSDEEDNNAPEVEADFERIGESGTRVSQSYGSTNAEELPSAETEHLNTLNASTRVSDDLESADLSILDDEPQERSLATSMSLPTLIREGTSMFNPGDFGDEDFDDEFVEGEEYLERRWMEEQRDMETMMDDDSKSESDTESVRTPQDQNESSHGEDSESAVDIPVCPICAGSMKGLSETQASSHVNACLDGNAQPLPSLTEPAQQLAKPKQESSPVIARPAPLGTSSSKRFQRAALARPGQANPFSNAKDGKSGGSAFSRLMSGHAEDAAWAEAASNEAHSRGKPAYQRTCPFYKIMPGLYICVDAFRYGKVEGQNAYFLSHFHSDHYIGLTSSWCHGPIYASKVTCNLMQQQLRVDPKWIHPLEFEKKVEVPNTRGVYVTMIPANHCPGSSLYLFEKVIGKNKDGSPRMTRILHCGDFRACPAHVNHPLLRPEVMDAVSGQTRQQSIDTCYLDTTYLTPKYSFPSQYDVIDACAQMCISLSKDIVDGDDSWEQLKREKAGNAMTKFLEQGEKLHIKKEEDDEVEEKPKVRGRLLVVIGTYSIGKERICLGIAKALKSKIYAPPPKMRICRCLEDAELNSMLTSDPLQAQVHMQTLMEIRAETLHDYLQSYKGHFARVVGFRPTGWSYRPPTSRFTENPAVNTVLTSDGWKSRFTMRDLAPQRGSTKESNCFGVPYSEHSSFRELTMFCCALRINRVVPTVNVGSARSREKMKGWIEKWDAEKRKNGLFKVEVGAEGWGSGDGKLRYGV